MTIRNAAGVALLCASAGPVAPAAAQPASAGASAGDWVVGPIIGRRNHSVAMPLHPTPRRGGGFHIDLPQAPGSAHYVTFRHGSLAGKRAIRMHYRVEAEPGARVTATTAPGAPGLITPIPARRRQLDGAGPVRDLSLVGDLRDPGDPSQHL